MKNKLCEWLVDLFPERLLYWCVVKIFAKVSTSEEFEKKEAGTITLFDGSKYYFHNSL